MYLIKNIEKLRAKFPYVKWNEIMQLYDTADKQAETAISHTGINTLKVYVDGNGSYLHSKYDPLSEACRIVDSLELKPEDHNLLFYGIGLGYVLDIIIERRPDIAYLLYEPIPAVFFKFLSLRELSNEFVNSLKGIYIKGLMFNEELELTAFLKGSDYCIKPVTLPIYERIYAKDYDEFCGRLKDSIVDKRFRVGTKHVLEKLWMHNTIKNFPYTIKSENILNLSEKVFRGKPAILVSSGPSLDEEIENLKKIKDKGLAYIFTAGSAVYKLLKHDIYPDAACAIDGYYTNNDIYKNLFENPDNSVPLIYADMMYNKVVSSYNAKLYNVVLENNTLATYYLKYRQGLPIRKVLVGPSVAIVTLHILHSLHCDPIILVGQNFALRNEYYYANGIDFHKNRQAKEKVTEKDRLSAFHVEDVNGNMIYTLRKLDMMRRNMEVLIKSKSITNVFNTTNGGAKISGTKYMPLSELMKDKLNSSVVDAKWYESKSENYDPKYVMAQHLHMMEEYEAIAVAIDEIEEEIGEIENAIQECNEGKLNKRLFEFSKVIKKLTRNKFYEIFVYPTDTLQMELLSSGLNRIAREENIIKRGKAALNSYKEFLEDTKALIKEIEPYFQEFSEKIQSIESSGQIE